jgi:hypothetical protein
MIDHPMFVGAWIASWRRQMGRDAQDDHENMHDTLRTRADFGGYCDVHAVDISSLEVETYLSNAEKHVAKGSPLTGDDFGFNTIDVAIDAGLHYLGRRK